MTGPVSFVTGAASGIGRHIAGMLLAAGHRVVAADLDYARLVVWFGQQSPQAQRHLLIVPLDVTDAAAWHAALERTLHTFGHIDHLFNVAGIIQPGWGHAINVAQIDRLVDVNVKGVLYGCRLTGALMVQRGHGHIINLASLAGLAPVPGLSLYSATKFAVRGYSLALAGELKPMGVAVTVISPDLVDTPMLDLQLDYPEAALTFSGPRPLTVADLEPVVWDALRRRPLEISIPRSRGALARLVNFLPWLMWPSDPILRKIGGRRAATLRSSRKRATP